MTLTFNQERRIKRLAKKAVTYYGDMTEKLQLTILRAAAIDAMEEEGDSFNEAMEYLQFIIALRDQTSYNPERVEREVTA